MNRKQWWLWLVLPLTAISILLLFVDMATGNYWPEYGIGLFSGIVALLSAIPVANDPKRTFSARDLPHSSDRISPGSGPLKA